MGRGDLADLAVPGRYSCILPDLDKEDAMVRLYRVTPRANRLAGFLSLSGDTVHCEVADPDATSFFQELMADGIAFSARNRWVRPEDGQSFLDAVVDALRTSSYWVAEPDPDPMPTATLLAGKPVIGRFLN
jgi:hypothetical protein